MEETGHKKLRPVLDKNATVSVQTENSSLIFTYMIQAGEGRLGKSVCLPVLNNQKMAVGNQKLMSGHHS